MKEDLLGQDHGRQEDFRRSDPSDPEFLAFLSRASVFHSRRLVFVPFRGDVVVEVCICMVRLIRFDSIEFGFG